MTHPSPNIGSIAPDFELQDELGQSRKLSELTSRIGVMLAFYPGDFRMVCTKQLCAYQESYDSFLSKGIEIVGISHNSPEEHLKFKKTYGFAFPLLSDPRRDVIKSYGVTSLLMLGGTSRAVFIVARNQRILYRYVEPTAITRRKPDELIQVVESLHRMKQI